jgi:hypothetical protein
MRLVARDAAGVLATTDVVLPVSDELNCRSTVECPHAGGGPPGRHERAEAQPRLRSAHLGVVTLDAASPTPATGA